MRDKTGDVPVAKVDRGNSPDLSRLDRPLEDPWVSKAIVRTAESRT